MLKTKNRKNNPDKPRFQLCETCKKANGGCAWSDNFKPVKGWTATPTKVCGCKCATVESYSIISCPEYEEDEPLKDLHDAGVINLLTAHLTKSVQEYIWAVQRYERNRDLLGIEHERTQDAKKTMTMFEQFVLPPEIAETAVRKYHAGEYDPDKLPKRTKLSRGE